MNSTTHFDVILAGGGLMGCATAYYLLKADSRLKVAIIEKDPTYRQNSTVLSDGNHRIQFNLKENIQISQYGLDVLETFADDMDVDGVRPDIAFRRQGNLFLVDESGSEEALAGLARQQSLGAPVLWLTPDQIVDRYPMINPRSCAGATFGPEDGTMDPHAVLIAYKNKAVSLGAAFIQAQIETLLVDGRQISGVRLVDGTSYHAKFVVNTAGAWAAQLARTAGINLPVDPIKRQVFVVETDLRPDTQLPLILLPTGQYIIHEHGGHFMCGKSLPDDPVAFEFSWNRQTFEQHLWPELVDYLPAFDRLKIASGWAGLYAVNTLDGNAILGQWPELDGFYLANGFSGHGFQQCHAVGRYLSELILGQPVTLDLSIFSPRRILDNRPVYESKSRII